MVTPVLDTAYTDYVYLFLGTEMAIYSLMTGKRVQPRMSDADKGFSFIMRGPVPGTYPSWKFAVCSQHTWFAQYAVEVPEVGAGSVRFG
jgi:hypothetical protein